MARGTIQRKSYLNCSVGKWREKVDQGTPGSTTRTTEPLDGSPGQVVTEIVDDYVEGEILDIRKTTHPEFGDKWEVFIQDGQQILVLQIRYDSGYAIAMLCKLPNVDLTRPVMFLPYFFPEEKKARMVLKQEGIEIPSFYPKEDPKGFPTFTEGASKNEIARWKLDVMDFLEDMIEQNLRPKLQGIPDTEQISAYEDRPQAPPRGGAPQTAQPGTATVSSVNQEGDPGPGEPDDLPF